MNIQSPSFMKYILPIRRELSFTKYSWLNTGHQSCIQRLVPYINMKEQAITKFEWNYD